MSPPDPCRIPLNQSRYSITSSPKITRQNQCLVVDISPSTGLAVTANIDPRRPLAAATHTIKQRARPRPPCHQPALSRTERATKISHHSEAPIENSDPSDCGATKKRSYIPVRDPKFADSTSQVLADSSRPRSSSLENIPRTPIAEKPARVIRPTPSPFKLSKISRGDITAVPSAFGPVCWKARRSTVAWGSYPSRWR